MKGPFFLPLPCSHWFSFLYHGNIRIQLKVEELCVIFQCTFFSLPFSRNYVVIHFYAYWFEICNVFEASIQSLSVSSALEITCFSNCFYVWLAHWTVLYANLSRIPTLLPSQRSDEQTKQAYKMLSDCFR